MTPTSEGFLVLLTLDHIAQAAFEKLWASRPKGVTALLCLGSVDLALFVPSASHAWLESLEGDTNFRPFFGKSGRGQVRLYSCAIQGPFPPALAAPIGTLVLSRQKDGGTWSTQGYYDSLELLPGSLETSINEIIKCRRAGVRTFSLPVVPLNPGGAEDESSPVLVSLVASVLPGHELSIAPLLIEAFADAGGDVTCTEIHFTHGSRDLATTQRVSVRLPALMRRLWSLRTEQKGILAVRTHALARLPLGDPTPPAGEHMADPFSPYFVRDLAAGRDWSRRMAEARQCLKVAEASRDEVFKQAGWTCPTVTVEAVTSYGRDEPFMRFSGSGPGTMVEVVFPAEAFRCESAEWEMKTKHEAAVAAAFVALSPLRLETDENGERIGFWQLEDLPVSPREAAETFCLDMAELVGTAVTLILLKAQGKSVTDLAEAIHSHQKNGPNLPFGVLLRLIGGEFLASRAAKIDPAVPCFLDLSWLTELNAIAARVTSALEVSIPCTDAEMARTLLLGGRAHFRQCQPSRFSGGAGSISVGWTEAVHVVNAVASAFLGTPIPKASVASVEGPRGADLITLFLVGGSCEQALNSLGTGEVTEDLCFVLRSFLKDTAMQSTPGESRAVHRRVELVLAGQRLKTWPILPGQPRSAPFLDLDGKTVGREVFSGIKIDSEDFRYRAAEERLLGDRRRAEDIALEYELEVAAVRSVSSYGDYGNGEWVSFNLPPWLLGGVGAYSDPAWEPLRKRLVASIKEFVEKVQAKQAIPVVEVMEGSASLDAVGATFAELKAYGGQVGIAFDDCYSNLAGLPRLLELIKLARLSGLGPIVVKVDQDVVRRILETGEERHAHLTLAGTIICCPPRPSGPDAVVFEGYSGWFPPGQATESHKKRVHAWVGAAKMQVGANCPRLFLQG